MKPAKSKKRREPLVQMPGAAWRDPSAVWRDPDWQRSIADRRDPDQEDPTPDWPTPVDDWRDAVDSQSDMLVVGPLGKERGLNLLRRASRLGTRILLGASLVTTLSCSSVDVAERDFAPVEQSLAAAPCSVQLNRLSYDDPGADDAEFIELRVEGQLPVQDGALATLSDCGLESIRLENTSAETCSAYRTLDVAQVAVPDDGFVLICATGSGIDVAAECDVTTAGTTALKNGWLQNGPADSLSFMSGEAVVFHASYEGVNVACQQAAGVELPKDTGSTDVDGDDDVIVRCPDGSFAVQALSASPVRSQVECMEPGEDAGIGGSSDAGGDAGGSSDAGNAGDAGFPTGSVEPLGPPVAVTPDSGVSGPGEGSSADDRSERDDSNDDDSNDDDSNQRRDDATTKQSDSDKESCDPDDEHQDVEESESADAESSPSAACALRTGPAGSSAPLALAMTLLGCGLLRRRVRRT